MFDEPVLVIDSQESEEDLLDAAFTELEQWLMIFRFMDRNCSPRV